MCYIMKVHVERVCSLHDLDSDRLPGQHGPSLELLRPSSHLQSGEGENEGLLSGDFIHPGRRSYCLLLH